MLHGPHTVRGKVTLLATAMVAAVLSVSGVALVVAQQQVLTHGIDESLRQRADNIQGDVAAGSFGARLPNEGDPEDSFLQVLDAGGEVVASSSNVAALPAAARPLGPAGRATHTTIDDFPMSNREFRVLARPLGRGENPSTLVVAKNLDDVHESVEILTVSLAIAVPGVTALLAVVVWWLTGRVLRPVERMRSEVAGIRGDQFRRRLAEPGTDDEIARLARTMNAMLDRVAQASERQRRFVADASHELRGPLTRIRSELELALAGTGPEDPATPYRGLLADTEELQKLVDDLLFLARSEAGAGAGPPEPVDLDDLVLQEAARLRADGDVAVDVSRVSAARTRGSQDQLARVVRNLATNAARHAGSLVAFEVSEQDGRSLVVVADDGPGIPPDQRAEVFKRFVRLDEARARGTGGAGLGLAIVRDIVTRHGGTVEISDRAGGGARFVVSVPRSD